MKEEGIGAFWRGCAPFVNRALLVGCCQVLELCVVVALIALCGCVVGWHLRPIQNNIQKPRCIIAPGALSTVPSYLECQCC